MARVLIADGNYPLSTRTHERAARVFLNLAPDLVRVTDVLAVLVDAIAIEAAHVMVPDAGDEPPIFSGIPRPASGRATVAARAARVYDAAREPDLALAIATGERRIYANILLAIGVVAPEATVR